MNPQQMRLACCDVTVTVHYSRTEYSENWWFSLRGYATNVCPECGCWIEYDHRRVVQPESVPI